MVTQEREHAIRKATRDQILKHLQDAFGGDELLMKEVWESCTTNGECAIAADEINRLIELIKGFARGF